MRKHIVRSALIVALLSSICTTVLATPASAAPTAQAAPGDLDTTFAGFGDNGVVTPPGLLRINDIVVQPDSKLVVVGPTVTANQLAVYRYLPNGQLDTSFDGDGKALYPDRFSAYEVALQSDGGIVVGGSRDSDFQLARLTPGGVLDPSFDGDGWAQDFDPQLETLTAILVQADGKIVACGYAKVGGDYDFGVTRYTASGARDTSFSGDGKVTIPFGGQDLCFDLALQNDGKLVAVGDKFVGDYDFAVARLKTDGTLDPSFDGDGKLSTGFGDHESAIAVALQPDDKIVVLGSGSGFSSNIARYLPSGALDGTFGSGGKRAIPIDDLYDLALQPDGNLLALGVHQSPDGDRKFALRRLFPSGNPDTTFNNGGVAWLDFGGMDVGRALALLPDGRILAAGTNGSAAVLARLWPDGTTFDTGGQQTHSLTFAPNYQPGYHEYVNGMALQDDGAFLVAGQVYNPTNTVYDSFLTRFTPDGRPDSAFGTNGSAFIFGSGLNNNLARAVAVQPDGKIVIAGYRASSAQSTSTDFQVARFLPSGAIDFNFGTGGVTVVDFVGGADEATALALSPDGKIVAAGKAWNGSRQIWGVVRLTESGQPDSSFGGGGKAYVDFSGSNRVTAVVVQPDRKIILGGHYSGDFFLQRLLENGERDPSYGINGAGYNYTDMGGYDEINALALAPNGWLYAAGYRLQNNNFDMALAQYTPQGILAACPDSANCHNWPSGTFFLDQGDNDYAYALDLRGDNQLVAAGCVDGHFAAVQVGTDAPPTPLPFSTDFVGRSDCATAVKFSGINKILLAGDQGLDPFISGDDNIALARFQTTPKPIKLNQTISFAPLSDRLTSDPPFALSATASSGLPVTFTSGTPNVCGVSGTTLSLTGKPGTCTVTAEQAGNATYNPATPVKRSFAVRNPARDQTISFAPLSDRLTTDPPVTLSATASSGLPVTFTSSTPAVCSVSGTTLSLSGQAGTCTVTASQAGDAAYNPAPPVAQSFAVRDPAKGGQAIGVESDPLPAQLARE